MKFLIVEPSPLCSVYIFVFLTFDPLDFVYAMWRFVVTVGLGPGIFIIWGLGKMDCRVLFSV